MKNQQNEGRLEEQAWMYWIGDLNDKTLNCQLDELIEKGSQFIPNKSSTKMQEIFIEKSISKINQAKLMQKNRMQNEKLDEDFKRKRLNDNQCEEEQQFTSNSYSEEKQLSSERNDMDQKDSEGQKKGKYDKQSVYSKNYRQRKKQKLKILQQENTYLKQKITQLQNRLRQAELQINRLKYAPPQKDLRVQQVNEQFIKQTTEMLSKTAIDPQTYGKTVYSQQDKFYEEFNRSYNERGFGGNKKKQILNYYFNQLMQALMRDSERYLFLICNDSPNAESIKGIQGYEIIDSMFDGIMEFDQDKKTRIKLFTENLHPFMVEFQQLCASFWSDFNKILALINKVHLFMKQAYIQNMDFGRKRIQMQKWFQFHKHSKFMRNLKSDWLDSIKKKQDVVVKQKAATKGVKKKKVQEKV